jgi:hypothetical protein
MASAFDVTNPLSPVFIAQIPLGSLWLPSGELRNKKSSDDRLIHRGSATQEVGPCA